MRFEGEDDSREVMRFEGEFLYNYKINGELYIREDLEFEGDFLYNKKYNGKGFDEKGDIKYELNDGNGKVVEYYDNNGYLYFEGEYLNGKKNGKGKEYSHESNNNLIYEGEFLNGVRNGHGIEYDDLKRLLFEGEFLNGKKWNGEGGYSEGTDLYIYESFYQRYKDGIRIECEFKY